MEVAAVVFCAVVNHDVVLLLVSRLKWITLSQVLVVMFFIGYCIVGIAS